MSGEGRARGGDRGQLQAVDLQGRSSWGRFIKLEGTELPQIPPREIIFGETTWVVEDTVAENFCPLSWLR